MPLPARVASRLFARCRAAAGHRVVVAVSGGVDSVVLLHLLRFAPELTGLELVAAHFDHRMRAGSADDARWVLDLARGWGIPFVTRWASEPPRSEAQARDARYAFLAEARAEVGARWILTAHHADDQAETVLFRIARGTGVAGLRGIPIRRGALLRPLLCAWRDEIEEYAAAHDLIHRSDPSNADPRYARNVIRGQVVPGLTQAVPGARRALVRLARVAAREERAWRGLVAKAYDRVVTARGEGRIEIARAALLELPEALRARVLRRAVRALGGALDEGGTGTVVAFTKTAASGRSHPLAHGVAIAREFDHIVLARSRPPTPERTVEIGTAAAGGGIAEIGGRRWTVCWSAGPPDGGATDAGRRASFALARLDFPLRLRGWCAGDHISLSYGSKKLKKLLGESRIPVSDRGSLPVLADAADRVLWVPGVARRAGTEPAPGEEFLQVGVGDGERA